MSILKAKVDQALNDLEKKRVEYSGKVQELEDICEEFEKQAQNLLEQNHELILLLKQVKAKVVEGRVAEAIDLLVVY